MPAFFGRITPEMRIKLIDSIQEMLNEEKASVNFMRSVRRTTRPEDAWETYAPGKGRKIVIEVPCGPEESYDV